MEEILKQYTLNHRTTVNISNKKGAYAPFCCLKH